MTPTVQEEYIQELKVARQYLDPRGTRLEVDQHIRTGLPLTPELAKVVLAALAKHKEITHEQDPRTA